MDVRRQAEVVERVESALQDVLGRHGRHDAGASPTARVVIVHRENWMRARLRTELELLGIRVLGDGEDGAVGLALALVEQPELLFVQDKLAWVTTQDLLRTVRVFARRTTVIVQGDSLAGADDLVAAGATAVYGRGVAVAELAARARELLVAA